MIFINKHYLPDDQTGLWEVFRESAQKAVAGVFKIDERMKPIIAEFNKIEGVATRFCCQGHASNDGCDNAYVMLVCNEKGLQNLLHFNMQQSYNYIQQEADGPAWRVEHSVAVIANARGTEFWYPCVVFRSNEELYDSVLTRHTDFLLKQLKVFNNGKSRQAGFVNDQVSVVL